MPEQGQGPGKEQVQEQVQELAPGRAWVREPAEQALELELVLAQQQVEEAQPGLLGLEKAVGLELALPEAAKLARLNFLVNPTSVRQHLLPACRYLEVHHPPLQVVATAQGLVEEPLSLVVEREPALKEQRVSVR